MKKEIIRMLVVVAFIAFGIFAISRIGGMQEKEEASLVREAILQSALTCYSVEGRYPGSVDYLRDHYRLAYNEDRFLVTYDAFASNKIPNIYVTERGAGTP